MFSKFDREVMRRAIEEARVAVAAGEIGVGAAAVRGGKIIALAHNDRRLDPLGHAEILAIRRAAQITGDWRLNGVTLYVTLEPCPMCAGAIIASRVCKLIYGASDKKSGCAGSVYRITEDPAFDHFCRAEGGLLADECAAALVGSFETGRDNSGCRCDYD